MALITKSVTITASDPTGESTPISVGGSVVGISIPSNWTAAPLSFLNSYDSGINFLDMFDQLGNPINLNAQVGFNQVSPDFLVGAAQLVIRSGLAGSVIVQADDVVITLIIETAG